MNISPAKIDLGMRKKIARIRQNRGTMTRDDETNGISSGVGEHVTN